MSYQLGRAAADDDYGGGYGHGEVGLHVDFIDEGFDVRLTGLCWSARDAAMTCSGSDCETYTAEEVPDEDDQLSVANRFAYGEQALEWP